MKEYRWESCPVDPLAVSFLASGLKTSVKDPSFPLEAVSRLLVSNGICHPAEAMQFLKPSPTHLHNPFLLKDVERAVDRLRQAVHKKEKVLFYGDYDADGVTTTALGVDVLTVHFGLKVDYHVPHRHRDGYGLNPENLTAFASQYDLILSGDTGIKDFEAVQQLNGIGKADLIITDHHEPLVRSSVDRHQLPDSARVEQYGDEWIALPDAYAVVNPHRLGDPYPNKALSGAGVLFKVLQALFIAEGKDPTPLYHYLDLVALGLVADLVPQLDVHSTLQGTFVDMEVRTMTSLGLQIMNRHPKPWVNALRKVAGIKGDIRSSHLGFAFGPRMNAPGRLGDPAPAVELLLEKEEDRAVQKAEELNASNTARKELQEEATRLVLEDFSSKTDDWHDYACVTRTLSPDHHSGIAGLIASDLVSKYYRTSIVFAEKQLKNGTLVLTGSARSIPGVSVIDCLKRTQDKIGPFRHGGHPQAAGMTIEAVEGECTLEERFESFRLAFRDAVIECQAGQEDVFRELKRYNTELQLDHVTLRFAETLDHFEPFGTGNGEPVFCSRNAVLLCPPDPLSGGKHAKLTLAQEDGTPIKGLLWERGEEIMDLYEQTLLSGEKMILDLLYTVSINTFSRPEPQLVIQDYKRSLKT